MLAVPRQAPRLLFLACTLVSVAFFVDRYWTVIAAGELFHRLGFDWSHLYAQALALRSGAGPRIYDPAVISAFVEPLAEYSTTTDVPVDQMPLPYPPWFAAALEPLTFLPPPVAFGVWLAGSLLGVGFL